MFQLGLYDGGVKHACPAVSQSDRTSKVQPMDRFPPVRILAAMALMTLFSLAWNGLVHGLVLASLNQALADIGRPTAERSLALGLLLTAGLAALFVASLAATASLDENGRIAWRHLLEGADATAASTRGP